MIAKERLWKTADGKIVKEGDKDALSLLCAVGKEVPKEDRSKLNDGRISKVKKETEAKKEKRKAEEAVELQKKKDKEEKEKKDAENKEKTGEENKGGLSVNKK